MSLIDCDTSDRLEPSALTPHSFVSNCGRTEHDAETARSRHRTDRAVPWRKAVRWSQRDSGREVSHRIEGVPMTSPRREHLHDRSGNQPIAPVHDRSHYSSTPRPGSLVSLRGWRIEELQPLDLEARAAKKPPRSRFTLPRSPPDACVSVGYQRFAGAGQDTPASPALATTSRRPRPG